MSSAFCYFLISFAQKVHPFPGGHCWKSVAPRETDCSNRVRLYNRLRINQDTALGLRDSFENHDLAGFQVHLPADPGGYGNLAAFSHRCFHMINISCKAAAATESFHDNGAVGRLGQAPRFIAQGEVKVAQASPPAGDLIRDIVGAPSRVENECPGNDDLPERNRS